MYYLLLSAGKLSDLTLEFTSAPAKNQSFISHRTIHLPGRQNIKQY